MYKFLFIFLFLLTTNPAKADIIHPIDTVFPMEIRLPFYIFLAVLAIISFISVKRDLKKQEQAQNELKEE